MLLFKLFVADFILIIGKICVKQVSENPSTRFLKTGSKIML